MYEKENVIGTLKFLIALNFLIYYFILFEKIKKKHHNEFEDFIDKINKQNNLTSLEKKYLDKNTIIYTIIHKEEN